MIAAYSHLESQGKLPVRIFGEIVAVPELGQKQMALMELEQDIFNTYSDLNLLDTDINTNQAADSNISSDSTVLEKISDYRDTKGLFRLQTGKLFLDGVIEGHTGYLLSPLYR